MTPGSKVLVVDDDLAARLRLRDLLAGLSVEIREALDGREALNTVREFVPDLILLDIMMPDMTGYEVCAAVRENRVTRDVAIIVLSAADESEAMLRALDAGADDFLAKPFSAPELRAKVRNITRLNRYRALAGERDRFRWMLNHSQEPVVIAAGDGTLVYANDQAVSVFGLLPGVDVPTTISARFHLDPPDAWAAWRELRLRPGDAFTVFQPESAGLRGRWYKVELHVWEDEASQTVFKFTDCTRDVRHELDIYSFQSLISQQIRMPLCGLAPILTLLEQSEAPTAAEHNRTLLTLARRSAQRLQDALLGILNYHDALFTPQPGAGSAVRRPLRDLVVIAAGSARLDQRVTLVGPAVRLAQAEKIEFALTKLLENFARYTDAPTLGVTGMLFPAERGRWGVKFVAPGPGVPAQILEQLGEPYVQFERSGASYTPGVGLDLAMVRLLLRFMGGDLKFADAGNGTGLCTTVYLPAEVVTLDETDA
jgi:two-component system, cell cycle response regulator